MAISDMLKRNLVKSDKFKEAQENMQIQQKLEERSKSSNERELERFYEEEREKKIARNLEEFRNHRQKEAMSTTVLGGKFMFGGKGNIASGPTTVMKNNDKLLSMKSGTKQKGMFFK